MVAADQFLMGVNAIGLPIVALARVFQSVIAQGQLFTAVQIAGGLWLLGATHARNPGVSPAALAARLYGRDPVRVLQFRAGLLPPFSRRPGRLESPLLWLSTTLSS